MSEFFLHSFNTLSHGFIGYIIPFLFVLTIVVFFHELGHFLIARWAGVKVLTFSLGFGPELVGFNDRHGTRWKISAVPLGGRPARRARYAHPDRALPRLAGPNHRPCGQARSRQDWPVDLRSP